MKNRISEQFGVEVTWNVRGHNRVCCKNREKYTSKQYRAGMRENKFGTSRKRKGA
jgi:hypothetical protein